MAGGTGARTKRVAELSTRSNITSGHVSQANGARFTLVCRSITSRTLSEVPGREANSESIVVVDAGSTVTLRILLALRLQTTQRGCLRRAVVHAVVAVGARRCRQVGLTLRETLAHASSGQAEELTLVLRVEVAGVSNVLAIGNRAAVWRAYFWRLTCWHAVLNTCAIIAGFVVTAFGVTGNHIIGQAVEIVQNVVLIVEIVQVIDVVLIVAVIDVIDVVDVVRLKRLARFRQRVTVTASTAIGV